MTEEKTPKKPRKKGATRGVPFGKKDPETGAIDPRINTKGRKFGAMAFRRIAKEIAAELVKSKDGDEEALPRAELLLRSWADPHAHPSLQMQFAKYVAGNPDSHVNVSGAIGNFSMDDDIEPDKLRKRLKSLAEFEFILEEMREDKDSDDGSGEDPSQFDQ